MPLDLDTEDLRCINNLIDELEFISSGYPGDSERKREELKRFIARLAGFPVLDHGKIESYIAAYGYPDEKIFQALLRCGHFDKKESPDVRPE